VTTRVTLTAAAVTGAGWAALRARPPGGAERWSRTNFREEPVTLLLGPAVAAGSLAGLAVAGPPRRAALLLVGGTAALGLYDDLYGDRHARGLRGHLRALREGRVTSGLVKLVGLVSLSAAASALQHREAASVVVDTVLVAGAGNLVNLLDLRPGRAGKATVVGALALAAAGAGGPAAGTALGACAAALAEIGWAASCGLPTVARTAVAAAVVAVTLAGEWVSFSAVIDAHPVLRAVDRAGSAPR
jgi:hypothetical protein